MGSALPFLAARTPRTLWIELTSKCPFDCVFCSRKTLRGAGEHLPFPVFESLIGQLDDPRILILNYSGESTVYPDLVSAIRLARATGAWVELVSAMASAPESLLEPLSRSGLNRLTVSLHATDPRLYSEIYRHSSFATLRARLERFLDLAHNVPDPPVVDLSFVAMDRNLAQFSSVADFAGSLGLREILVFPVIRRDEIPVRFPAELADDGNHHPAFEDRVCAAVDRARQTHPAIRFTIGNPSFTSHEAPLGAVPVPYPGMLPPHARVYSCLQNPWETAHVLASGDVVACEVLDKIPLGNLHRQSIGEIWQGEPYRRFRARYRDGDIPECRSCPWKQAYQSGPLQHEIVASRGASAQLVHGWHDPEGEPHIWSSQQAAAVLAPWPGSRAIHLSGGLPPGPGADSNRLTVRANGVEIGKVENTGRDLMFFGMDLPVAPAETTLSLEFRTRHIYRPSERGTGRDQRDLGFLLVFLSSQPYVDPAAAARRKRTLTPLVRAIQTIDRAGNVLNQCGAAFSLQPPSAGSFLPSPGLTVLIPERANPSELALCLESLREAARQTPEPIDICVIVNGSPASDYDSLRRANPAVLWRFHPRPLGFAGAIHDGLRRVRRDWVYLLNNDVALDPAALRHLLPLRDPSVFSISSQIFLKDVTRFREETNWGALFLEQGLATIHDWIPRSEEPCETFYSGGGASLFQTRLLRRFLRPEVYAPFYWEDVEWGWRARKLGYHSLLCPQSIAHHRQQATIARCYPEDEIELIRRRNRMLFQLRNLTAAGSLAAVIEEIAASPRPVCEYFRRPRTLWHILRGRLWNHLAPVGDEAVLAWFNPAVPPGTPRSSGSPALRAQ